MTDDLYRVLGITKDASKEDVRNAYRKLAKKYHPDLNPGDTKAEENFKNIQSAYGILSDETRRAQYDAGEIDAEGNETYRNFYKEYASTGAEHPYQSSAGFEDLGDIFSDFFGARGGGPESANIRMRGGDTRYTLEIDFLEAIKGAKKRVVMPDGNSLDITIPPGLQDGQVLRLRGKGSPGLGGGEAGNAYVEVTVGEHPVFRRRGNNIHSDLAISLDEAVLGGKVKVPTVSGDVMMTIPAASNTGDTLRLRGKGVPGSGKKPAGDHVVTLRVVLPENPDDDLKSFLEEWRKSHRYDPRTGDRS